MMKLKAKDFKDFWIVVGTALLILVIVFVSHFNAVSHMNTVPSNDFDIMIYLLITERKSWISGIQQTLLASVLGTAIGFVIAMLLAYIRSLEPTTRDSRVMQYVKYILVVIERFYVTVVRGTPMMVQACIIYYAGFNLTRSMMPNASIAQVNQVWSLFTAALITVFLNSAAYLAEVMRGGIDSIDQGQKEAAESLGFTQWQSMTRIIFPQAVRNCLPSIINELINNIKGTSVLTVIGFGELMFATTSVAGKTYQYLPAYSLSACLYLLLVLLLSWSLNTIVHKILNQSSRGRRIENEG